MGAKKNTSATKGKGTNKTFASKRTLTPPVTGTGHQTGSSKTRRKSVSGTQSLGSFQEHDAQRRLGSFEGKGEHARTGNRGHQ